MERTVVRVLDSVPPTPGWVWLPEINTVALSSCLDQEGRSRALLDLQAQWRREMLHIVPPPCPDVA